MKTKTIFFALMFFVSSMNHAQKSKKIETVVIKTTIYCDHCEKCESCGGNILKQLYNEKGIKDTEVNSAKNTITVIYDTRKTSIEAIRLKITQLGFDADEVKADPAAVEKLDDCCKKPK
jgi:periplasmic mercuric ion binding protein